MSRASREFKEGRMEKELQTAEARAFGGPEATESDELEPGNVSDGTLKEYKVDEMTPGTTDSTEKLADYADFEGSEASQEKAIEQSPAEEQKPLTMEDLDDIKKLGAEIKESLREPKQEYELPKEEKEMSELERKNALIKEHKDVFVNYMQTREKAIQLQEQIKKDDKAFSRLKKFLTGTPKSNLMEDYKKLYDSLKEKEADIEGKTGVNQNELLKLWEQYKQAKERKHMMEEKAAEERLFTE